MLGRPPRDEYVAEEHSGHHRRSDLVFRIAPGNRPNRGDHVALTVDLRRVLFFGADGRRVTPSSASHGTTRAACAAPPRSAAAAPRRSRRRARGGPR